MRYLFRRLALLILPILVILAVCAFYSNFSLNKANIKQENGIGSKYRGGLLVPDREWFLANIKHWNPGKSMQKAKGSFDWRDFGGKDYTTSVKDQGFCGSCASFAALSALESVMEVEHETPEANYNLSEQHLFACSGGNCQSGIYQDAIMDELKHNGVPVEDCFRYKSGDWGDDYPCSDTCSDWVDTAVSIKDYWYVGTRDLIKSAIEKGPVIAGIEITSGLENYSGGVFQGSDCHGPEYVNHAVALVGYNDSDQYYIAKNSWGKSWGEKGFFKIAYGKCGIEAWVIKIDYDTDALPDDDQDDDQDDDSDDDSFEKDDCTGLIGRLYSECSASLVIDGESLNEVSALAQCETTSDLWRCVNACGEHDNVTDCESFFTCLENRCEISAVTDKSDKSNDEESGGSSCGK